MTLDDLLAREGIRDLVARYNSYSDTGRFEPLWELFAEQAVMETGDAGGELSVYDGREQIKQIFTGARERVQQQLETAGPTYIRHFTATHQIDLVDADHAAGRCYFAVIIDSGLDHWGRYIDRYVRVGGQWTFEHRRVLLDGRVATSWFAS
ncbi:MAG: nuclear transport factor 2 family protein [Acidimicrobiia bacterium]